MRPSALLYPKAVLLCRLAALFTCWNVIVLSHLRPSASAGNISSPGPEVCISS